MQVVLNSIKAALFVSLFIVKFGQGLDIAPHDLLFFRRRWGLMVRSIFSVMILMPLLALIIILLLKPARPMAIAIAVLAASPAAPLAISKIRRSGGTPAYGASLQFAVAVLAVIFAPLILWLMAKAVGFEAIVQPLNVAGQVAVAQLIPIGLGVLIAAKFGKLEKIGRVLARIAVYILLAVAVLILVKRSDVFTQMSIMSYVAIFLTVLGSLILGHAMAPRDPEMQTALAVETAMRNPGLALLIASLNFPNAKPLPLLIPYIVIIAVLTTLYVEWQRKRIERRML